MDDDRGTLYLSAGITREISSATGKRVAEVGNELKNHWFPPSKQKTRNRPCKKGCGTETAQRRCLRPELTGQRGFINLRIGEGNSWSILKSLKGMKCPFRPHYNYRSQRAGSTQ